MRIELPESFEPFVAPAPFKGAHGGRGSAKSHSFAEMLILGAGPHAAKIPWSSRALIGKPELVGCFREVQNSIRDSVKKLLDQKIEKLGYRSYFDSTDTEIRGARGEQFIFRGLRDSAEGARSIEGMTKVWCEEAHQISQKSLDTLLPTLRAERAEFWATWNPDNGPQIPAKWDPVDKMFRGPTPPPGAVCVEVNYEQNPFFPEFLRTQMEWDRRRDVDRYNHIWRGKYRTHSEARVFKNWRVEDFVTPEEGVEFLFGADWGFNDPTVMVRSFVRGRTLFIDAEVYMVGCDIDHLPALFGGKEVATDTHLAKWGPRDDERFVGIPGARRSKIIADNARPETIAYMKKNGFPFIESSIKGKGSVEDGVEFLKSYDIVVHPRCKNTVDELSFYSWKVHEKTGEILNVLADKNNHVIDSLRYSVEKLRRSSAGTWAKLGAAR